MGKKSTPLGIWSLEEAVVTDNFGIASLGVEISVFPVTGSVLMDGYIVLEVDSFTQFLFIFLH